jgi:hypothetical protein
MTRHSTTLTQLWATVVILIFAMLASGCTFTGVKNVTGNQLDTPGNYEEIVVGKFAADKLSAENQRTFSRAIQRRLKEAGLFQDVAIASDAQEVKKTTVVLTGEITEFTEGNRFMQWFIGFGAGASEAAGTFELSDIEKKQLLHFTASSKYAGGLGIGGVAFLSAEDLLDKLASAVADQTIQWVKGDPVN